MLKRKRGVFFDLDGLLLDTEPYQYFGWAVPLKTLGIDFPEESYKKHAGKSGKVIAQALVERYELDERFGLTPGKLLDIKRAYLHRWFRTDTFVLQPFAREALLTFSGLGIPFGICSGGPRDEILLKLDRSGLLPLIDQRQITSMDEVWGEGKPEPEIYLLAMEKLGRDEGDAFEDTVPGAEAVVGTGKLTCRAVPSQYMEGRRFPTRYVYKNLEQAVKATLATYR